MSWEKYKDIIDLPRPVSARHPPMSNHDRAIQFAPFAALTGYDDRVKEEDEAAAISESDHPAAAVGRSCDPDEVIPFQEDPPYGTAEEDL